MKSGKLSPGWIFPFPTPPANRAAASKTDAREYFFVTRTGLRSNDRAGNEFLVSTPEVFGNYYGTARRFLREAESKDSDLLLDIDVQGAVQVKRKLPRAVSIFILPPNRSELEKRLRNRSLDSEEVIQRRLVTASREIENYDKYDYILVNDRLEDSADGITCHLTFGTSAANWRATVPGRD